MTTRREALVVIAGSAALPASAQHQHGAESAPTPAGVYKPKTLSADEMDKVGMLTDLIIPRTDTAGASEAGVPEFIDRRLTASPDLAASFREGMASLGVDFATIPPARQIALFTEISNQPESPRGRFFRLLKDMTVDGYYSSRAGLVDELGWHGNTFLTEFKGCTHPEHQV